LQKDSIGEEPEAIKIFNQYLNSKKGKPLQSFLNFMAYLDPDMK
jgi:hypothetical protein